MNLQTVLRYGAPALVGAVALSAWEYWVRHSGISPLVVAGPTDIAAALVENFSLLAHALLFTMHVALVAFAVATVSGIAVAILFSQSRIVEYALYPYAIVLQVTPTVAIAPLLLIWIGYDNVGDVLVMLAWIISFFTILSNTVVGLKSADHNLIDLFRLYGASRWQILWRLQLPGALPYILAGMKVSGGLALIGAVTAELVAGTGTDTGLGWIIILAGRNLETAKVFAALALLSALGIAIFFALTALEWALLHRWHESALKKQR